MDPNSAQCFFAASIVEGAIARGVVNLRNFNAEVADGIVNAANEMVLAVERNPVEDLLEQERVPPEDPSEEQPGEEAQEGSEADAPAENEGQEAPETE